MKYEKFLKKAVIQNVIDNDITFILPEGRHASQWVVSNNNKPTINNIQNDFSASIIFYTKLFKDKNKTKKSPLFKCVSDSGVTFLVEYVNKRVNIKNNYWSVPAATYQIRQFIQLHYLNCQKDDNYTLKTYGYLASSYIYKSELPLHLRSAKTITLLKDTSITVNDMISKYETKDMFGATYKKGDIVAYGSSGSIVVGFVAEISNGSITLNLIDDKRLEGLSRKPGHMMRVAYPNRGIIITELEDAQFLLVKNAT